MRLIELSPAFAAEVPSRMFDIGVEEWFDQPSSVVGLLTGSTLVAGNTATYMSGRISLMSGTIPADTLSVPEYPTLTDSRLVVFEAYKADFSPTLTNHNPVNVSTTFKEALLSGEATWFHWHVGALGRATAHYAYGTVGLPGSGANLIMPDTNIVAGETYRITNFQMRFPTSWTY